MPDSTRRFFCAQSVFFEGSRYRHTADTRLMGRVYRVAIRRATPPCTNEIA